MRKQTETPTPVPPLEDEVFLPKETTFADVTEALVPFDPERETRLSELFRQNIEPAVRAWLYQRHLAPAAGAPSEKAPVVAGRDKKPRLNITPRPGQIDVEFNKIRAAVCALAEALGPANFITAQWAIGHETPYPIVLAAPPGSKSRPGSADAAFEELRDRLLAPRLEAYRVTLAAARENARLAVARANAADDLAGNPADGEEDAKESNSAEEGTAGNTAGAPEEPTDSLAASFDRERVFLLGAEAKMREAEDRLAHAPKSAEAKRQFDRAHRLYRAEKWSFTRGRIEPQPDAMLWRDEIVRLLLDWAKLLEMAHERFKRAWADDCDDGSPSGPMGGPTQAETLGFACASAIYFVYGREAFKKIKSTENGAFHCLLKAVAFDYGLGRPFNDHSDPDEFSSLRDKIVTFREDALKDPSVLLKWGAW